MALKGFELEAFHRDVSNDELIGDLRRVAELEQGKRISTRVYDKKGKYHSQTISNRFGGWENALETAGLEHQKTKNFTEEELLENLTEVWLKLGRQPKYRDLTKRVSRFSASTYAYRFGGWRNALRAFVDWANYSQITPPQREEGKSTRGPREPNWRQRAQVLMRDGATCQLCGQTPKDGAKLHIDHIVPWSNGGKTDLENLQVLCERCNIGKSDLMPPVNSDH